MTRLIGSNCANNLATQFNKSKNTSIKDSQNELDALETFINYVLGIDEYKLDSDDRNNCINNENIQTADEENVSNDTAMVSAMSCHHFSLFGVFEEGNEKYWY